MTSDNRQGFSLLVWLTRMFIRVSEAVKALLWGPSCFCHSSNRAGKSLIYQVFCIDDYISRSWGWQGKSTGYKHTVDWIVMKHEIHNTKSLSRERSFSLALTIVPRSWAFRLQFSRGHFFHTFLLLTWWTKGKEGLLVVYF